MLKILSLGPFVCHKPRIHACCQPYRLGSEVNPAIPARSEPRVGVSAEQPGPEKPSALLYWFSLLLAHRRGLLLAGLVGGLIAVGVKLTEPAAYTATALAVMDNQKTGSTLSGITAQLGLSPIQGDGSPTPYFYADLVTSDLVLRSTVDSSYEYRSKGAVVKGNLVTILKTSGVTPAVARERAVAKLRKIVSARVTPKTGVISISATTPDPELAPQIVARLIGEVNRINILSRQSQAGGEREFTGRRVVEAAQELRAAENQLQDFLQQNRDYHSAPRTAIEEDRLARTVAMRQSIYTSVSQAYEQARIDEARDTPGLRVVEPATVPISSNPRGLAPTIILGVFVGLLVAICIGLWRDYVDETESNDPEQVREFRNAVREAAGDLTHPWRLFSRRRKA
jgi:uncharacterized protein involved in exopolysaccharide biosynthesis